MRTRNNILKLLLAIICVLSLPTIHSQVDAATTKVVKKNDKESCEKKTKQLPPSQRYNYKNRVLRKNVTIKIAQI